MASLPILNHWLTERDGLPKKFLYRVRFQLLDIWSDYAGSKLETLDVEIYEHWLEPVKKNDDTRPLLTKGMHEEELAALVTRDSIIGVALPLTPQDYQAR